MNTPGWAARPFFCPSNAFAAGPGFPQDYLPHAFERFGRADEARGEGGVGLGLAIVEAIAEAHSRRAGARSAPDGGADVWIELGGETLEVE